jgi:hypothetical protein
MKVREIIKLIEKNGWYKAGGIEIEWRKNI